LQKEYEIAIVVRQENSMADDPNVAAVAFGFVLLQHGAEQQSSTFSIHHEVSE
jgi:hypothetical protein